MEIRHTDDESKSSDKNEGNVNRRSKQRRLKTLRMSLSLKCTFCGSAVGARTPCSSCGTAPPSETLQVHVPSSTEARLVLELTSLLAEPDLAYTWLTLIPARVGRNEAVDLTLKAVRSTRDYSRTSSVANEEASQLGSYGRALKAVQDTVDTDGHSDEALLSVALLSIYERTSASKSHAVISHLRGIEAILTSRSAASINSNDASSRLTGAILYSHWSITFLLPCVYAVKSPFDDQKWMDIEPALCHDNQMLRWDVLKLRKASHRLFLSLPRFVFSVRELRTTSRRESTTDALLLAKELIETRESQAENELLHRLKIQKPDTTTSNSNIMPLLFGFANTVDYEAGVVYWQTRLFALRLCWRLHVMFPTEAQAILVDTKTGIQAEISRMATNLLMAFGRCRESAFQASCSTLSLCAIVGALRDFDVFAQKGLPPHKVRSWIGGQLQDLKDSTREGMSGNPMNDVNRMEEAAEVLAGGPCTGAIVDVFRQ